MEIYTKENEDLKSSLIIAVPNKLDNQSEVFAEILHRRQQFERIENI